MLQLTEIFIMLLYITFETSSLPQKCTRNPNKNLNCTIETGEAMVQCPKENVIRIIGDYQKISVHCERDDFFKFTYYGTLPTEAIRVNSWRDVGVNKMNLSEDPMVLRHHTTVEVLSVTSLFAEYIEILKPESSNLSARPEIYYSRSGEFRFASSASEPTYESLSYHIFFEEPKVLPGFINRYELNDGFQSLSTLTNIFVNCRSTHYFQPDGWDKPELWIDGDKRMQVSAEYDPTAGFYTNLPENNTVNWNDQHYYCVIPHKTNPAESITFDPMLKFPAHQIYLKNLSAVPNGVLSNYIQIAGKFNAQCLNSTLYFIAAKNPIEQVLVRNFVLPDLANRSLYVEKGTPSLDPTTFITGIVTHRGTSMHMGAVYCGSSVEYDLTSFATDVNCQSSFRGLSHSINWRKIHGGDKDITWPLEQLPSQASAGRYLQLNNTSEGKIVYDFDNLTFHCHLHPFFLRKVVWEVIQNGNTERKVEEDVTQVPSMFQTKLNPGVASISCWASVWAFHTNWVYLKVKVNVLASEGPKFEENQQIVYEFAHDALNPQVKLIAFGVPRPTITCNPVLLNEKEVNVTHLITDVSRTNKTISTFTIEGLRTTEVFCNATNPRGFANLTINIVIKPYLEKVEIITISVSSSTASLLVLIVLFVFIKYGIKRRKSYLRRQALYKLIQNMGDAESDEEDCPEEDEFPHLHPFDFNYEIDHSSFTFDEFTCLSKTAVKQIYPGYLHSREILVKTTLKNAVRSCTTALLNEYKLQIYLGNHPNLVQLLGASTSIDTHGRVFIFEEVCAVGTLQNFLRCNAGSFILQSGKMEAVELRNRNTTLGIPQLFDWSIQILEAMEYLSDKRVIHRDLCTKNILMTSINTVKVSGLENARRLYAYPEYSDPWNGSTLSWRWMALESMRDRVFSVKSDVWSMGVTLWEIFNYAEVPYGNKAKKMVMVFQLENGLRLEKPSCGTEQMHHKVLMHCWNANPDVRPHFAIVKELIKAFKKDSVSQSRPLSIANRMSTSIARLKT